MDGIGGKTISIVSHDEIRYVGIIDGIDGENKIITISNVRIFGTEDRINDPTKWILPRPEIYPKLELNGDSVKLLNILESNVNEIQPILLPGMYQHQFNVPGMNQLPQQSFNQVPINNNSGVNSIIETSTPTTSAPAPVPASTPEAVKAPVSSSETESGSKSIKASEVKSDSKNKEEKDVEDSKTVSKLDTDFNFDENNAKFEKDSSKPTLDSGVSYNKKSSFFDDLSSSVTDNSNDRMTWNQERSLNEDTFGQASLNNNNGRNGRGRGRGGRGRGGRGRGGRGRGGRGGRGRGGFNNSNNNGGDNRTGNSNYNSQPEWAF